MLSYKEVEIPRYSTPKYIVKHLSDLRKSPYGHRFLMYFQAASYKVKIDKRDAKKLEGMIEKGNWDYIYKNHPPSEWRALKDSKRYALEETARAASTSIEQHLAEAIIHRQKLLAERLGALSFTIKTTSPIATGLGNPHPVENGFSFLSPYGLPYLSGSSIKGVLRRAAEEKALFDGSSEWTIPLVWLAFGFEEKSAYLSGTDVKVSEVKKESERWLQAFREYVENKAEEDQALREFINQVKEQIPEAVSKNPKLFCVALQEDQNLRKSIHYHGLLNFWDAFFKVDSLRVDILNPHHKEYYEGNSTPHDAEQPKPVFFLSIPPGSEFTIFCEISKKAEDIVEKIMPLSKWENLIKEIVSFSSFWLGFGAKTSVGYGVGEVKE